MLPQVLALRDLRRHLRGHSFGPEQSALPGQEESDRQHRGYE